MWESKDNISIYLLANQYLPEGKQQKYDCFKRLWIIHPAKTNIDNVVRFDILTQDFVFNLSFWSNVALFLFFNSAVIIFSAWCAGISDVLKYKSFSIGYDRQSVSKLKSKPLSHTFSTQCW